MQRQAKGVGQIGGLRLRGRLILEKGGQRQKPVAIRPAGFP